MGLLDFLSLGNLMGHNTLSDIISGAATLPLAWEQWRGQQQAEKNNTNALGSAISLAGAMGNETMPSTFGLTQYDEGGNPYTKTFGLGYNPVQDLLNYQRSTTGNVGGYQQGTIYGNYNTARSGMQDLNERILQATKTTGNDLIAAFDRNAGGVLDSYGRRSAAYQRDLGAAGDDLLAGYGSRYQRGMDNLAGMGEQARRNINEQYNTNASNINSSLARRGLGNTTVLSSMQTGNERERSRAIGELDESLRQQRLNTDASLSGDTLAAKANVNTQRAGAAADAVNTYTTLENQNAGNRMSLLGNNYTNNLNALMSGWNNLYGLDTGLGNDLLAFNNAIGQQRQSLGNASNQNLLSILTGTTFGYPDNSAMNAISQMWSGRGGYRATQDAMNIQDKQYEQSLVMGGLGLGLSPLNAFTGSYAGGLGLRASGV